MISLDLKVNLSGTVNETMFMSRLYTWMHFWLRFSVQVFRNRVDNRPNPRDMYRGTPFCRCFSVQVRLVQKSRNVMNMERIRAGRNTVMYGNTVFFTTVPDRPNVIQSVHWGNSISCWCAAAESQPPLDHVARARDKLNAPLQALPRPIAPRSLFIFRSIILLSLRKH